MKNLSLLLLVGCLSFAGFAQKEVFSTTSKKAINAFKRATGYFNQRNNDEALQELEKAVSEDENFIEAYMLRATIYEDQRDIDNAIISYRKIIDINPAAYPKNYFYLAKLEMKATQYSEAKQHLQKLISMDVISNSMKDEARKLVPFCEFASMAVKVPVAFEPKNMGDNINTPSGEYSPAITADESFFYFTRLNEESKNEDVYVSRYQDGQWTLAANIGAPINSDRNEGAMCISPDGRFIFFTACNRGGGMGSCDIYISEKIGDKWSAPENLGAPVNTSFFESQPSFSSDGKTLYFVSSRTGGLGKTDIWSSTRREDGTWADPVNLGPTINTALTEYSPFIHADNQTLYFTSDGHPGMGSQDFFFSRRHPISLSWGTPVNLGYPINTQGEERSLTVSAAGKLAIYSTDGKDTRGVLDLYTFELYPEAQPQPVTYLKGKVRDAETGKPIQAHFQLIDLATEKEIVSEISDKVNGEFIVCLPSGKDYALNVSKEGYLFFSETFNVKKAEDVSKPVNKDIALKSIKVGESVVLKNIFFDTDSYTLKNESKAELKKLKEFMANNPKLIIELGGHTDNTGDRQKNQSLSMNRAKAVYDVLVTEGIPATRLSYKGYADLQPIAGNETAEGRAQNRRTEFTIMKMGGQ